MDKLFLPRKVCHVCGVPKIISTDRTVSEFSPHKGTKDGFQTQCKACRNFSYRENTKRRRANPITDVFAPRKTLREKLQMENNDG